MKDVLIKARNLISDPSKWCKKHTALDANGNAVSAHTSGAVQWCAMGACIREGTNLLLCIIPLDKAAKQLGYTNCADLNDESNHETVMKMFDLAIGGDS